MTPTSDSSIVHIPKCCTTGDPECKHVINKDKRTKLKKNPAL